MPSTDSESNSSAEAKESPGPARSNNEVALELMRFIAHTTGYGKAGQGSSAGFSGKPQTHSPEEHAEALLELFERCRRVVNKE
ncbi:MAG TPA: hypothetical protein VML19_02385 [Verrucomicrobiae bacterium]|nr:hypothetical protein [Verrucomicrobiae bacterium]